MYLLIQLKMKREGFAETESLGAFSFIFDTSLSILY